MKASSLFFGAYLLINTNSVAQITPPVTTPPVIKPTATNTTGAPIRRGSVWVSGTYAVQNGQKTWVPGHWERIEGARQRSGEGSKTEQRLYVTAPDNFNWVFPDSVFQNGKKVFVSGHWERQRSGDLKNRLGEKAGNAYPLTFTYGRYPTPKPLGAPKEVFTYLSKERTTDLNLTGDPGRLNIYYCKKLEVRMITVMPDRDYVIVADTFYVPPMQQLACTFIGSNCCQKLFIKIIANCLIYESPINVSFFGKAPAGTVDFVFSAEKIFFRHPARLKPWQLKPSPPLFYASKNANDQKMAYYQDASSGEMEVRVLNRLNVNSMEMVQSKINGTFDPWERDKLVNQFQVCRSKIKHQSGGLQIDPSYGTRFNNVCKAFDDLKFKIERIRSVGALTIIVDGERLPIQPIRYYALPNKAQLLPVLGANETAGLLGTILYQPTGDAKLKLFVETELGYQQDHLDAVKKELGQKSVVLSENLPQDLIAIQEQPLKISGKTVGKIIPVSNRILRLEIDLLEEAKSIATLFPKVGTVGFKIDYTIDGNTKSQEIHLSVDKSLLDKLNYGEPLVSFAVVDDSPLSAAVRVSSHFDAAQPDEGRLDYLEVLLEFQFGNGMATLRGPYRLSAYNTLAADVIVPFLKQSSDYKIIVSGRALYENGERNFQPFETKDQIIGLDESVFMKEN